MFAHELPSFAKQSTRLDAMMHPETLRLTAGVFGRKIAFFMAKTIDHPALPRLKERFADVKLRVGEFRDMVTVVVPRERIADVCLFLRDDAALRFEQLFELNAVDYLGYPGAEHRFAVNYGLLSHSNNLRLWLRVFLDPTLPTGPGTAPRDEQALDQGDPGLMVPSVYNVWPAADWFEREQYDLMGIIFTGHPDLRRIMTWNGFGSHPLRKDYPLRGVGEREDYKVVTRESA
jgi:NADH-quinone oxidoreductase subunit C